MTNITHTDKIGQPLAVGDMVVYIRHGNIHIGYIRNLTPKRVQVLPYTNGTLNSASPQHPHRIVKIENSPAITKYILTKK
jgi:hypothetical protein